MAGSVLNKTGVKDGMRAFLVNVPKDALRIIASAHLKIARTVRGTFDHIHFFTTSQSELEDRFPKLKTQLKPSGMLWVSCPKNRKLGTDLTLTKVIELGYNHGLVESKTISVDATWSAIKFTHPKKGKEYKNSYGRLKA